MLQLLTESLVVYEGGSPGLINVQSLVPPTLFCPSDQRDGCQVRLYAGVRAAQEKRCPDQRVITQAVVEWQGAGLDYFCGVSLDGDSWDQAKVVAVKGVVDALKDGDQERTVEVWLRVSSDQLTTPIQHNLGQVKVSCSLNANAVFS